MKQISTSRSAKNPKMSIPNRQQLYNYLSGSDEDVLRIGKTERNFLDSTGTSSRRKKDGGFMNGPLPFKAARDGDAVYGNGDVMKAPKRLLSRNASELTPAGSLSAFVGFANKELENIPLSNSDDRKMMKSYKEMDLINFCKDDYTLHGLPSRRFQSSYLGGHAIGDDSSVWQRSGVHDNPPKFDDEGSNGGAGNFDRGTQERKRTSVRRKKDASKNDVFAGEQNGYSSHLSLVPPPHLKSRGPPNVDVNEYKVLHHVVEGEYENLQSERGFHGDASSMAATMTRHRQFPMQIWDDQSIRQHQQQQQHQHSQHQQQHSQHQQQQQQQHQHYNSNLPKTNSHVTLRDGTLMKQKVFDRTFQGHVPDET